MTTLPKGLLRFADSCKYSYREYSSPILVSPEFRKYIEFSIPKEAKDTEIPVFAVRNMFESRESLKRDNHTFIVPVYDNQTYLSTVSTINMFFALSRSNTLTTVVLKDKKYKIGRGVIFDANDNLIFISTVKYNNDNLEDSYYSHRVDSKIKVYVCLSVLENVKNTIEKAIIQKLLPYLIRTFGAEIVITDRMPFEKLVVNNVDNDNFNSNCNEIIKEELQQGKIQC